MPALGAVGFKIIGRDGVSLDEASWGYPQALKAQCDARFSATTFVGAGHAIRRRTWLQAGGYDEGFFFTWEEYDFCLKAIALNWRVEYDGSIAVIHKLSAEGRVLWREGRVEYAVRNRLLIARKWGASWLGLLPRMAGYVLRGWLNRCFSPVLAGIRAALNADADVERRKMPPDMRQYIALHETRHRGPLVQRLRREVFVRMRGD
jgi:GT2 family glycosyltransferase